MFSYLSANKAYCYDDWSGAMCVGGAYDQSLRVRYPTVCKFHALPVTCVFFCDEFMRGDDRSTGEDRRGRRLLNAVYTVKIRYRVDRNIGESVSWV